MSDGKTIIEEIDEIEELAAMADEHDAQNEFHDQFDGQWKV